jgi:putative ABC transport system permease protein
VSPREIVAFAAGALAGHRLRSALSLAGVAIGIAAVVLLTALGEGARRYVLDQFAQIGANFVGVVPGKVETTGGIPGIGGAPNDLTLADARALARGLSGARVVVPLVVGTETVARGERSRQVVIAGSTPDYQQVRRLRVARGSFLPPLAFERGAPVVVLGARVARELFPAGDAATDAIGSAVRVGGRRCRVIGVLAPRGTQMGMNMDDSAIVPVATAMQLFNRSSLFRILIDVAPGVPLDVVKEQARAILVERHGEEDVTLVTEDSVKASLSSILGVLTAALVGIAAISLGVAGIGILNVLLVSVAERTGEIGLLRAVGASRGQIRACFLTEAALLSTAGGFAGVALGWLGTRVLVGLWPALPASPPAWAVAAALAVACGLGTLFGWLPARRATELDPVAALARG